MGPGWRGASGARRAVPALAAMVALVLPLGAPKGEPPLPSPGSASAVASLVARSSRIEQLPDNVTPNLFEAINDDAAAYYPVTERGCRGVAKCVFGDRSSKTTIVLFGDSHAYMWLPALVPYAVHERIRLVLVWLAACPAATVTVWDGSSDSPSASCNAFRASSIASIRKIDPTIVLLASRTTQVNGPSGGVISSSTWMRGLETTIRALKTPSTKVAVIGDIAQFSVLLPDCLSAEQGDVQACASPDPNPKIPGHYAAEQEAARATHVAYLNPQRWLCTKSCSPVIGNMIAYYNNDHVTATYAAYLATVFSTAVAALLPR
jgi:hypothetical protein